MPARKLWTRFPAGAGQFYLVVSRLMPYKNVDRAIAAFADMPQRKLAIVGKGPEAERLAAMCPDNVRMFQGPK